MTRLELEWDWQAPSAIVFLRISLGVGEAAGDSAAEGEVALSAGEVARFVFACGVLVVKGIR